MPFQSSGPVTWYRCPNYPGLVSSCPNPIWRRKSSLGETGRWRGYVTQTFSVLRLTLSRLGLGVGTDRPSHVHFLFYAVTSRWRVELYFFFTSQNVVEFSILLGFWYWKNVYHDFHCNHSSWGLFGLCTYSQLSIFIECV